MHNLFSSLTALFALHALFPSLTTLNDLVQKKSGISGPPRQNWSSNKKLLFALYPGAFCRGATNGKPSTRPARKMEGQVIAEDHEKLLKTDFELHALCAPLPTLCDLV